MKLIYNYSNAKWKLSVLEKTKLLNYELDEIIIKLEETYCENAIYIKSDTDKDVKNMNIELWAW